MEQKINVKAIIQHHRIWLFLLAITCIGIGLYGYDNPTNMKGLAYFLTASLLPIFLIWGIFHFALGRKRGGNVSGLVFLAMISSLTIGTTLSYANQQNDATQVINDLQNNISSITQSAYDAQGFPQHTEKQMDTAPISKTEAGEMGAFMKTFLNEMMLRRNNYLQDLNAIGFNNILDPQRLKSDTTLVESKIMLNQANKILRIYKTITLVSIESTRRSIIDLNVSEKSKIEMMNGWDDEMVETRKKIDAVLNLESKQLSELGNIIALLDARKGAWSVQDNQILFTNDSDIEVFNHHLETIQKLASEQSAIQKQSMNDSNNTFNNLKHE